MSNEVLIRPNQRGATLLYRMQVESVLCYGEDGWECPLCSGYPDSGDPTMFKHEDDCLWLQLKDYLKGQVE